ncbi:hypothetical protein GZ78_03050 [Endozoicomonas numazuensis]|uniref:Uncharacterized protein n=1 Tax=Endozoicomonas numazuensis TaxID=1137799 RepID=A0A081NKQ2_9GAMM|nr:hypothetical protein GZ78_03050 [Endozoicomonas numazuensis]
MTSIIIIFKIDALLVSHNLSESIWFVNWKVMSTAGRNFYSVSWSNHVEIKIVRTRNKPISIFKRNREKKDRTRQDSNELLFFKKHPTAHLISKYWR